MEGTPGHPNQPLGLHTASQDQVEWERWNLRKVDETDPLRQMDRQAAQAARVRAASSSSIVTARVPRESRGISWIVRFAQPTRSCSRAASASLFWTSPRLSRSRHFVSRPQHGSATVVLRRRATPSCSCSPKSRAPARARPACSNARQASPRRSRASLPPHHVLRRSPGNERHLPLAGRHRDGRRAGMRHRHGCRRQGLSVSFAAIYIPEFPVAAWQRISPELRSQACAVLEGVPPQERSRLAMCEGPSCRHRARHEQGAG